MKNKMDENQFNEFTSRFNITVAALSLVGVLSLGGLAIHKNVDHLNSKCPFAFLYGDKIIEHHISTICKDVNKDCLPIYVAPEGYLMTNGYCYKKTEDGSIEYTSPILVGFKTEDGVKNLTEIYEQIYGLYETEDKTTDSVAECNNYLDSTTYVKNKKLSI